MSDLLAADAQIGADGAAALWVGDGQAPYATGLSDAELWAAAAEVARRQGTVLLTVYRADGTASAFTVDEGGNRTEQTGKSSYVQVSAVGSAGSGWDDPAPNVKHKPSIASFDDPLPAKSKPVKSGTPKGASQQGSEPDSQAEDVKAKIAQLLDEPEPKPGKLPIGNTLFTRKFLTVGAIGLVAMVTVIGVVTGLFTGAKPEPALASGASMSVAIGEPAASGLPFGFTKENWTRKVGAKAAVSTFPAAVVMVDAGTLELMSTLDGKTIRTVKDQGEVSFVVATQLGNGPAVAWKANGKLYAWDQKIGAEGKLVEIGLGPTDEVSSTGSSIIVRTPTTVSRLTSDGLKELPSDPATPVLSADVDGTTLASGFTGPLVTTNGDGASTEVSLVKPRAGWKVYKWISATTDLAVVAWAENPDAVKGDTRIIIAVHDARNGEAAASIEADESSLQDWKFTRGKSSERAIYGPYMFDLETGNLVADGTAAGVDFTDVAGRFGLGDTVRGTVVVEGVKATPTTAVILGMTGEGGMVVRTSSTLLTSFTTKDGPLS